MLTSRRPDTLHLYDFYSYWRHDVGNFTTLPQHLKENGYRTRTFGKIFHPGASSNYTDDYPYSWSAPAYHSPAETHMNKPVCPNVETGQLQRNVICPVDVLTQPLQTLPDLDAVHEAGAFLRTADNGDTPFFVAVGLHKPHIPLRFPNRYLARHEPLQRFADPPFAYVPADLPAVAFAPYADIRNRTDAQRQNISFPFGPMPAPFGMRLRQAYYAAVSYVDDLVGELLAAIDPRRTVVVLTSDHGWSLGEHAEWAKYSNYEVAVRVPLIVRAAHLANGGRRLDAIVELLDLFPTVVELAGGGVPALPRCDAMNERSCTEGRSLVPVMRLAGGSPTEYVNSGGGGGDSTIGVAYSQYPRPSAYPQANSDRPRLPQIRWMGYSMRTDQFRYTAWVAFSAHSLRRDWTRVAGEELYDHRLDGGELSNLAGRAELHGVRRMLRRRLRRKFP